MTGLSTGANASPQRVVVTGLGAITPVGLNVPSAWRNVVAGRSGIDRITLFDTRDFRVKIAGEAHGFEAGDFMSAREARRADRNVQFAIAASREALAQARLTLCEADADEAGVLIGSSAGGIWTYTAQQAVLESRGPRRLNPLLVPMITIDSASVQVAIDCGARGPNLGLASACSTGADALSAAFEIIRRGDAQVMITGGTDAAVTPLGVGGFDQLNALSRRNDAPALACRPFDAVRDGFVLSEGAGIVILESLEHALARGAEPLAEVLGCASTCDAAHLTDPDPQAVQAARAISRALAKAGLGPGDVNYINAHATGTRLGDVFEVRAVKRALGEASANIPISSTKSITGHLLGAAGAVEAIWCVMALHEGMLPPSINCDQRDADCDLDIVANVAHARPIRVALSNSFGFGGHNTVLALARWDAEQWDADA